MPTGASQQRRARSTQGAALRLLLAACLAGSVQADEAAQLDRYLERLGLTDLRLVHQEQQLAAASDKSTRTAQARQLADLYTQRLLEAADQPARFGELITRVEKLVREYPEINSPQLRVVLLQADYQHGEAKALEWIDDPSREQARREAGQVFARVAADFADRRKQLTAELEKFQSQADAAEDSAVDAPRPKRADVTAADLEREIAQVQALLARTLFFEGWTNFFQGLLEDSPPAAKDWFAAAESLFGQLLEIGTDGDKLGLDPEEMGLESIWRSRALLGLAATLAALDKATLAEDCFAALKHPSTALAVRDAALYWHLLALVRSGQLPAALELAKEEVRETSPGDDADRTSAYVLLVRTGWASAQGKPEAAELARLGLEGLARLKQFNVLGALVARHRSNPKASDGFYALWAKGKLVFAEAEKTKAAADYQAAAQWFQMALDAPDAKGDPGSAAQCRYSLAWCDYRQEKYDPALLGFKQAATQLKTLGDDTAVQAAWMAFTCHQQLHMATSDARHQTAAVEVLEDIQRDFPGSEQAQKAEVLLARLRAASESPEAAVKTLAAVAPGSPNYLTARYELAVVRHQLWKKAQDDKAKAALAGELQKDVDIYLSAAPQSEATKRVRVVLLALDVLLSQASPDWGQAAKYLSRIASAGEKLSNEDPLAGEFHYRRLQLAQRQGDEVEIRKQADWLASHAAGSPYELPGLVIVARAADEQVASASSDEKEKRRQDAITAYRRLVELLGESPEAIAGKKNTLVANAKLAQYQFEAGAVAEAAQRWERIVEALPDDRNYLRKAGLAWSTAGEHAKALPHWSKLVAGSESASDDWYEAKYHQLTCLANSDQATARKVWKQFKLLHPEVKSAAWREKFADLERSTFGSRP